MPQAFDTLIVPTVPGSRIATTEKVTDSSTFGTTEVEVIAVVAALVIGRIYRVRFIGGFQSDTAGDDISVSLREGDVAGSQIQNMRVEVSAVSSTTGYQMALEREVTAGATGNQTYIASAVRVGAGGICVLKAASTRPAYLYVEYIR